MRPSADRTTALASIDRLFYELEGKIRRQAPFLDRPTAQFGGVVPSLSDLMETPSCPSWTVASPFDDSVGFATSLYRPGTSSALTPTEAALAPRGKSLHRRLAFDAGRNAAHRALEAVGVRGVSVGRTERGVPEWPSGVCGSITHTVNAAGCYAAAAAALNGVVAGIGIDLERIRPISLGVLRRISSDDEIEWALDSPEHGAHRALELFTAREALFKAFYPLYRRPMRYRETTLVWDDTRHLFKAATTLPGLSREPVDTEVTVNYSHGMVLAGVVVPRFVQI